MSPLINQLQGGVQCLDEQDKNPASLSLHQHEQYGKDMREHHGAKNNRDRTVNYY